MSGPHHIQACQACVKAKRKCTRQSPSCLRCRSRNIHCVYSPNKHNKWVLLPETPPEDSIETQRISPQHSTGPQKGPDLDVDTALRGLEPLSSLDEEAAHEQLSGWFTSIHTWHTDRSEKVEHDAFTAFDLGRYIDNFRDWLEQWVKNGGNPFIHPQMYRSRLPKSIQDAYMSLTCYLGMTPANEALVERLIIERSRALLEEYGYDSDARPLPTHQNKPAPELDLLGHIARVQALLVYQFIGLFGGSISMRYAAQRRIDMTEAWTRDMVAVAVSSVPSGVKHLLTRPGDTRSYDEDFIVTLWHSWIVSETIRRTWNVMSSMLGLFSILQSGAPTPCPGSMIFTTRVGVWEAPTATAWQEICSAEPIGMMQVAEASRLITDAKPTEINSFAKVILELTYGSDKVAQWNHLSTA